MKNSIKKAAVAATMVSGLGIGLAQADTFQALLNIVSPLVLFQDTSMNLGSIEALTDTDTCTLASDTTRTGAACFGSLVAGSGVLASIDVTGTVGQTFSITPTGSSSNGMTFVPALYDNGQGGVATSTTLLAAGTHKLSLGGTLTVDDAATAAASGATSIDYDVVVAYP